MNSKSYWIMIVQPFQGLLLTITVTYSNWDHTGKIQLPPYSCKSYQGSYSRQHHGPEELGLGLSPDVHEEHAEEHDGDDAERGLENSPGKS